MTYPTHLIPTTVVGSYPQPDWLVDRALLEHHGVPRVAAGDIWRVAEPWLEQAQDDATVVAIGEIEIAGRVQRDTGGMIQAGLDGRALVAEREISAARGGDG